MSESMTIRARCDGCWSPLNRLCDGCPEGYRNPWVAEVESVQCFGLVSYPVGRRTGHQLIATPSRQTSTLPRSRIPPGLPVGQKHVLCGGQTSPRIMDAFPSLTKWAFVCSYMITYITYMCIIFHPWHSVIHMSSLTRPA